MGPLTGIRVVDMTMWAFTPACGGILSHWGADVVKIENPKAPDPSRLLGGTLEPGGSSRSFKNYNRGKRAITLNVASEEGREILYRLVDTADVFLTSFLPDVRKKLGFDVDTIKARNPNIIYAKGTGLGPLGPQSHRRGYDSAMWWSRSSLAYTAMQVSGAQTPTGMVGHGDTMSGTVLAGGICAALVQRALTGVAPVVDTSLLGTAVWFNHQPITGSTPGFVDPYARSGGAMAQSAALAIPGPRTTGSSAWCSSTTPTTGGPTSASVSAGPTWLPGRSSTAAPCGRRTPPSWSPRWRRCLPP